MLAASKGQPIHFAVWNAKLKTPLKILTWIFLLVGLYLVVFAYYLQNKNHITAHGGGIRGWWATLRRDAIAVATRMVTCLAAVLRRNNNNQADDDTNSHNQRSASSSSKKKEKGLWATTMRALL